MATKPMPMGTPIIMQREFLSMTLIIGATGDSILQLMQCLHENGAPLERQELSVDDSLEASPVYLFDVWMPKVQVETEFGPFTLRLTIAAVDGLDNQWFERAARRTVEFVMVADISADPTSRMVESALQKLQSESDRRLHLLLVIGESTASDIPFPMTQFVSVHRVKSLDDPKCFDVITSVAEDIVREAPLRAKP